MISGTTGNLFVNNLRAAAIGQPIAVRDILPMPDMLPLGTIDLAWLARRILRPMSSVR